jgi:hypothetical protein
MAASSIKVRLRKIEQELAPPKRPWVAMHERERRRKEQVTRCAPLARSTTTTYFGTRRGRVKVARRTPSRQALA